MCVPLHHFHKRAGRKTERISSLSDKLRGSEHDMTTEPVALVNGQNAPLQEGIFYGNGTEDHCVSASKTEDGVTPCCVPDEKWYMMRAAYGQEMKAVEFLTDKDGIREVFCPQWFQERTVGGKRVKKLVSILPNALFVRSTQRVLHQYIGTPPLTFFHHYYQPYKDEEGRDIENGRQPLVIPDGQMLSFRKWLAADTEDKIYMSDTFSFKRNDLVRVTEGNFEGFTGHVVRLKGQTRVGVNIEGIGFICTTYIPKNCLKIIN